MNAGIMSEAQLDDAGVEALLRDIAALGEGVSVRLKQAATSYSETGAWLPANVLPALQGGGSAQLRYRFDGEEFVDTLLPLRAGVIRLIRTTLPGAEELKPG